jgi:hypothetical protein
MKGILSPSVATPHGWLMEFKFPRMPRGGGMIARCVGVVIERPECQHKAIVGSDAKTAASSSAIAATVS